MHARFKLALQWMVVGMVVAYLAYSQYESHVRSKKKQAERQAETDSLVKRLHQAARQHSAQVDWAKRLQGKEVVRLSPVMSAELQEVWQQPEPILFVGTLKDIVKNEDGSFQVLLQYDGHSGGGYFLSTTLFLSAQCPEEQATPLLTMAKTSDLAVFANVAIVGRVLTVASNQARGGESNGEAQLTGFATCAEAIQIDKALPEQWIGQDSPR